MKVLQIKGYRALAAILLALMVPAVLASSALGKSQIRFMHAVPGVGEAELTADGTAVGSAGFGEVTGFVGVASGPVKLRLTAPGGVVVNGSDELRSGRSYTVIAMARGPAAELKVLTDGAAKARVARLRMVHASPELGEPNIVVDGKVIARDAPYGAVTPYRSYRPGTYTVKLEDPQSGQTVLAVRDVPLAAGTTSSAVVVGSRGEQVRAVLVADATLAPAGAPEAGLGGLAGGEDGVPWLLALAAALVAGAIGGTFHRLLVARRGRAG